MNGWMDVLSIMCFRRAKAIYNYYLEPRIEYRQVSTVEPAAAVKPSLPPWLQCPEVDVIAVQPLGSDDDDTEHPVTSSSDEERDCFIEELTSHHNDPMTRLTLADIKEEIAQMADIDYLGKLYFSLHYNLSTFTLVIKMIKAEDLPEHLSLCPGVFLETFLCPVMPEEQQQKSELVQKLLDPVFHQTLELELPYEETLKQTLTCRVCYLDKFTQKHLVGEIIHPLDHLEADNMDITKEEVVVCREIQQIPEVEEVVSNLIGQLMFSLTFIPEAKRLTVVIFKARVIKFPDDSSVNLNPAIFVEVSIQHNNRRKRRMTTMKIGSLNPVYNEAITFDLSALDIKDIKLQFVVKHQANRAASKIIGRVVLGPNCEGQAQEHWEKALVARKPLAYWHDLQEYNPADSPKHKKKPKEKRVIFTDKPVQRFLSSSDEE